MFANLSVLDNVRVGTHARTNSDIVSDSLKLPWVRRSEARINERVHEILRYLDLDDVAHVTVAGLPFGTQKRVELARALAADPKILLLDEPAGGLNHEEVHVLGDLIRRIRDERKMTVLLVEHHMGLVMSIADHVVALNFGRKLAEGTPAAGAVRPRCHQGLSREQGPMTAMLNIKDLRAYYGQVQALHGLEFGLNEGSLTTLLGANGAGKTTTLRAICNMVRSTGSIEFDGAALLRPLDREHRAPRHRPCAAGPRHLHHHDGGGKPPARRHHPHATGPASSPISSACTIIFRC